MSPAPSILDAGGAARAFTADVIDLNATGPQPEALLTA
jgi:hypothetical protein